MDEEVPPPYEELVEEATELTGDGRIGVDLNSKLARGLSVFIPNPPDYSTIATPEEFNPVEKIAHFPWELRLNIVIQVVGSRGDVQPFIALGNELQKYGHRVRLATHNVFDEFVTKHGLEFFPIGGDPEELMAYMVKNPGVIPSMKSMREGDIARKQAMIAEMLDGCWKSCLEPDPMTSRPFVADAIIANPPSFAHVHCAQALGIPVHLMFTMPWTNTRAFPHPLANLKNVGKDPSAAFWISYSVVEWLTWQGLGGTINKWRRSIDLEEIGMLEGPNLIGALEVPFTYCWSPALVPKPLDWPAHVDICGFFFRDAPDYTPPPDLDAFLKAGPPPVYIGFGSIVIDDPVKMSNTLIDAVQKSGARAIISRGWSKLDGPPMDNILYLGDCPHEWLFQYVSAVVHHGGAGTTACGLLNGRPTTIVPFFGDQPFWGKMVAAAGAGPDPINHKILNAQNLAEAITFCLTPAAALAGQKIADQMRSETGVRTAVDLFHSHLPRAKMECDIFPNQPAVWQFTRKGKTLKLSRTAAAMLSESLKVDPKKLEMYQPKPVFIEPAYREPITSGSSVCLGSQIDAFKAGTGIFYEPYKEYKKDRAIKKLERSESETRSLASSNGESSTVQSRVGSSTDLSRAGSTRGPSTSGTASSETMTLASYNGESASERPGVAGRMAAASGKSLMDFGLRGTRAVAVDIPFAVTEGLKNVPSLYGDKVRNHGRVTDWKSGAVVGGKTLMYGMGEGMTDMFYKPYEMGKRDGALGALKGVGVGSMNLVTKTSSGLLGMFAYPSQGIYRSIRTAARSKTRKAVMSARLVEGVCDVKSVSNQEMDRGLLLLRFEELLRDETQRGQ